MTLMRAALALGGEQVAKVHDFTAEQRAAFRRMARASRRRGWCCAAAICERRALTSRNRLP